MLFHSPPRRRGGCFLILTFHDSNWPQPRDPRGKVRALNDVNHCFDVSHRFLFCEPLSSQGLNYDTAGLQFLLNFLCSDTLFRCGSAQYAARAMTGRTEGLVQGGFLAQEEV